MPLTGIDGYSQILETTAQQHVNWCFGGIAELVDNAHDSGAKYLYIDLLKKRKMMMLRMLELSRSVVTPY